MFHLPGEGLLLLASLHFLVELTCNVTAENGESLQVLHYEVGQKYEPHHDYFTDEFNVKRGGQRVATVLMYLYVKPYSFHNIFHYIRVS